MFSRGARSGRSVLTGGRWLAALAGIALVVLTAAVPASAAGLAKLVITFGSPSPSEGATLTTSSVQFAFAYNRTPKQTQAVTCTLSSPTTSSTENCTKPVAAGSGSSSGASYSNLANGPYTFTVTVTLTDGGTAKAARDFTVAAIAKPGAPTGLTAATGDTQVDLSWSAPANSTVSSYNVYEGTSPGGESGTPVASSTTTSATVTGLTNGVAYYFVVTAVNGAGPGPSSNEASATPELPSADLSVTNTDDTTGFVAPGGSMSYTIVVSNSGPGDVTGATVSDTMPTGIVSDSWAVTTTTGGATATQPGGAGDVNDTVNMPSGSSITFVVHVAIDQAATGTISDTATVTAPAGIIDPNPVNNAATDSVPVELPQVADLTITNTDDTTGGSVAAGGTMNYTIVVSNKGPGDATGATVADMMPTGIMSDSWTVTNTTGGATATQPGANGDVNDTVNMPSGSSITFVVHVAIDQAATGMISDTATVAAPAWVGDPNPFNNVATDTVTVGTWPGAVAFPDVTVEQNVPINLYVTSEAVTGMAITSRTLNSPCG